MTVVDLACIVAITILVAAVVLTVIRLIRGPTTSDRIIAVDLLGLLAACIAAVGAVLADHAAYLDIAVGISLLGFLAVVSLAGLIERIDPRELRE